MCKGVIEEELLPEVERLVSHVYVMEEDAVFRLG
jgi:hypothetical protein